MAYSWARANSRILAKRSVSPYTAKAGGNTECESGQERNPYDGRWYVITDDSSNKDVYGRRGD